MPPSQLSSVSQPGLQTLSSRSHHSQVVYGDSSQTPSANSHGLSVSHSPSATQLPFSQKNPSGQSSSPQQSVGHPVVVLSVVVDVVGLVVVVVGFVVVVVGFVVVVVAFVVVVVGLVVVVLLAVVDDFVVVVVSLVVVVGFDVVDDPETHSFPMHN